MFRSAHAACASGITHERCAYLRHRKKKENKTPAKAFTPPAKTKMITRPGRAVTRAFIGGVVYSLIFVLPRVPSKAFSDIASTSFLITKITKNQCLACLSDLPGTLPRVPVRLHFLEFDLD